VACQFVRRQTRRHGFRENEFIMLSSVELETPSTLLQDDDLMGDTVGVVTNIDQFSEESDTESGVEDFDEDDFDDDFDDDFEEEIEDEEFDEEFDDFGGGREDASEEDADVAD